MVHGMDVDWAALWDTLCHQGTVTPASFAALPMLTEMAQHHPPAGYVDPLALAAAIVASEDGPADLLGGRQYVTELAKLQAIAERNLSYAQGAIEFVYALQALLSFEAVPIWKNRLVAIADEELELDCPACNEHLLLDLGPNPTMTIPADPNQLTGGDARMHALAVRHNQREVAGKILHLLGSCVCPQCNSQFQIQSAL